MSRYWMQGVLAVALCVCISLLATADDADSGENGSATDAAASTSEPAGTEDDGKDTAETSSDSETAPTGTESTGPAEQLEPWQELHRQWLEVDRRLQDAEMRYYHSPKEQRFEIRDSFEKMVKEEANPLLVKLRAEAIKAYTAKPNEDPQLAKLLVGFMINHARMEQEADAKEIVELLIDHNCDQRYVLAATRADLGSKSQQIVERMVGRFKEATGVEDVGTASDSTSGSGGEFGPVSPPPGSPGGESSEGPRPEPENPEP